MNEEWTECDVSEEDRSTLNDARGNLILWIVERFRYLRAENRESDALCFADEWFEWLSPDDYINAVSYTHLTLPTIYSV